MVSTPREANVNNRWRCYGSRHRCAARQPVYAVHVRSFLGSHRFRFCVWRARWDYCVSSSRYLAVDYSAFGCSLVFHRVGSTGVVA